MLVGPVVSGQVVVLLGRGLDGGARQRRDRVLTAARGLRLVVEQLGRGRGAVVSLDGFGLGRRRLTRSGSGGSRLEASLSGSSAIESHSTRRLRLRLILLSMLVLKGSDRSESLLLWCRGIACKCKDFSSWHIFFRVKMFRINMEVSKKSRDLIYRTQNSHKFTVFPAKIP